MVDVEERRVGEDLPGVDVRPAAGDDVAAVQAERDGDGGLNDEDLVAGVLAVAIGVDPVGPCVPAVGAGVWCGDSKRCELRVTAQDGGRVTPPAAP